MKTRLQFLAMAITTTTILIASAIQLQPRNLCHALIGFDHLLLECSSICALSIQLIVRCICRTNQIQVAEMNQFSLSTHTVASVHA